MNELNPEGVKGNVTLSARPTLRCTGGALLSVKKPTHNKPPSDRGVPVILPDPSRSRLPEKPESVYQTELVLLTGPTSRKGSAGSKVSSSTVPIAVTIGFVSVTTATTEV